MAKNTQHLKLTPGIDKNGKSAPRYKGKTPSVEPVPVVLKPARTKSSIVPKRKVQPLAPALQELLTKKGIDPATVRLRAERPNPDTPYVLSAFIGGKNDGKTDEYGDILPEQAYYSVRLAVGETNIYETGLAIGDDRNWPDEDFTGPEVEANLVLAQFGVRLMDDDDDGCFSEGDGEWQIRYNLFR